MIPGKADTCIQCAGLEGTYQKEEEEKGPLVSVIVKVWSADQQHHKQGAYEKCRISDLTTDLVIHTLQLNQAPRCSINT